MRHHVMDYTAGSCLLGFYIGLGQYSIVSLNLVIFNHGLYLIDKVLNLSAVIFRCLCLSAYLGIHSSVIADWSLAAASI